MAVSSLEREEGKDQKGRKLKEFKEEKGRTDLRNGDGEKRGREKKERKRKRYRIFTFQKLEHFRVY